MSFVDPTQPGEDENDQNPSQVDQTLNPQSTQQAQQPQDQQAPPSTSAGGAGAITPGGSGAGSPAQAGASAPKPSSSGSWTNLDSYLKANSDQASQIGSQIASTVDTKGMQAQGDISNLGTNFSNAVNQNVVQQDDNAVNKAISGATGLTAGQTLNADDQQNFYKQANANYAGPNDVTSFNGYDQAQKNANSATQSANATKSEAGRDVLLQDQFKDASKYGYSKGENNLDQMLLQNSKDAQDALSPLAAKWSGLSNQLSGTVNAGANQVQQAVATNQNTSGLARNALANATQTLQGNLTTGLNDLNTTNQNLWSNLQAAITNGQITPDEAQALGFNLTDNNPDSSHNYLAPNSLAKYFSAAPTPTLSSFANADQYAQAAALDSLAGGQGGPLLDQSRISEAGTATTAPAYAANSDQFRADNSTASAEYQNQQSNDLKQIQSIGGGGTNLWIPFSEIPQFNSVEGSVQWAQAVLGGKPTPNGVYSNTGSPKADGSIAYNDAATNAAWQIMTTLNKTQQNYGFGNYFNPTTANVIRR